jgi:hypothetical protein
LANQLANSGFSVNFSYQEQQMTQMHLPMLTVYEGPKFVADEVIAGVKTYREAVQKSFELRTRPRMSNALIAEEVGCCASHVGDYVTKEERKIVRNLPAEFINAWEVSMGNRVVNQWMNAQAQLTILEALIQRKAA